MGEILIALQSLMKRKNQEHVAAIVGRHNVIPHPQNLNHPYLHHCQGEKGLSKVEPTKPYKSESGALILTVMDEEEFSLPMSFD